MKKSEISSASSEYEMDVGEGEEKDCSDSESTSDVEIDDEENEPPLRSESVQIGRPTDPFMDSFYGLSSADIAERSHSAQVLLRHCLLGPDANAKDASYALKRLLNGLCSGRAASRQGMASALVSFLKYAFRLGRMEEIRKQNESPEESELTHLAFIRKRLKSATEMEGDQRTGRKRESEERDYQFGQLFGINAVIRSGLLLPIGDNHPELDDIERVSGDLIKDLVTLYSARKWMREPATHAIATLLNSFFKCTSKSKESQTIVKRIIIDVVVPNFLQASDSKNKSATPVLSAYSVEQLALVLNIQSNLAREEISGLPFPINKPLLTKDSMQLIAPILSETSSSSVPRVHFVWDTIFSYLTEAERELTTPNVEIRKIRKSCPLGTESVEDIVGALVQYVIIDDLLGGQGNDGKSNTEVKNSQDRTALALRIIRGLTGVEYLSSLTGRTKVIMESQILDSVILTPTLIKILFLDVLAATTGGRKQQVTSVLKTESLLILETLVQNTLETQTEKSKSHTNDQLHKRLTVAKAFVRADPRFDVKTKTSTVADLLGLGGKKIVEADTISIFDNFVALAINQISISNTVDNPNSILSHEAIGYIDLVYQIAQSLMRTEGNKTSVVLLHEKRCLIDRILRFFMISSFFDCKSVNLSGEVKGKKSKKKSKDSTGGDPYLDEARKLRAARSGLASVLPQQLRIVLSARFFSIWAGYVSFLGQLPGTSKESDILKLVAGLTNFSQQLIKSGAVQISESAKTNDKMDDDDESPNAIVEKIMNDTVGSSVAASGEKDDSKRRLSEAFATLAASLSLHLLSCGQIESTSENADLDIDQDDDEDAEEIQSFLQDIDVVYKLLLKASSSEENPLHPLAELCANILSSHLGRGNSSKGGSPSIIRETVRMAWTSGLTYVASLSNGPTMGMSVVNVLLNAIGASGGDSEDDVDGDSNQMEDDDDDDDQSVSVGTNNSTSANKNQSMEQDDDDNDDDDVELDPSGLQSMLEEESDAEIELEHHEGADAALARLIQAKKDARKVGQQALERVELSRQLRCVLLLETLALGKAETWGSVIRVDSLLQIIVSIIKYRGKLLRSLSSQNETGAVSGQVEKRALYDRLTTLVKSKLLKTKGHNNMWTETVDVDEMCMQFTSSLDREVKLSSEKEQQSLCNGCLMFMLRNITDDNTIVKAGQLYSNLVIDWSMKRSKMIDSSFFESMILQYPSIAPICLTQALAESASSGKTTYLKTEAYRLLVLVYNSKLHTSDTTLDKVCMQSLSDATKTVMESICTSLQDSEMMKTKRVREVLKVLDKVLSFERIDKTIYAMHQSEITDMVNKIKNSSESTGISQLVDKVLSLLSDVSNDVNSKSSDVDMQPANEEENADEDDDDEEEANANETTKSTSKAKKSAKLKKKKKNKKKR